jgi:hypothetical protein
MYVIGVLTTVTEGGSRPTVTLTASLNLCSRTEICYRTMPRTSVPRDVRLQPDLRLSTRDAAVRRVATVVPWFERLAGLNLNAYKCRHGGHVRPSSDREPAHPALGCGSA